jgi:hypothetical protein
MAHTPLSLGRGDGTAEGKMQTLPQLKRAVPGLLSTSGSGPTPTNDGTPPDPDIATALANPSQWVIVTNGDGSVHHVIPAGEMARPN